MKKKRKKPDDKNWWSKEVSKNLYLPKATKNSKPKESENLSSSWFQLKEKYFEKEKSSVKDFDPSDYDFPEVEKVNLGKKPVRTLKIRIFPDKKQKEELNLMFQQFRWYYNAIVRIYYCSDEMERTYETKKGEIKDKSKFSYEYLRDFLIKHRYINEVSKDKNGREIIFDQFIFDEKVNSFPVPKWWENSVYTRVPRGAVKKFTSNLNSALSNKKNGNIKDFDIKFRKKKETIDYLHFEDKNYPSFIREIESNYWFTTKDGKRKRIPYSQIFKENPKGLEIIHEKLTDKYFIYCPVSKWWFPEDDRRKDNQFPSVNRRKSFSDDKKKTISLDPGVRKFLVGYDPDGKCLFIGNRAFRKLESILEKIDQLQSFNSNFKKKKKRLWTKIKNVTSELHWKVSDYLTKNYNYIFLPEFRTSQMVQKPKEGDPPKPTISKKTRRSMNMFSFYKFKEKLQFKCQNRNRNLFIIGEHLTSKICSNCGSYNDNKDSEVYECKQCYFKVDRDINGSRNILIKNISLRSGKQ